MKILAIDPGYERLGIAVITEKEVIFSTCFKTLSKLPFPERLFLIGQELERLIKKYKPEILAIETLYFTTNQKTAIKVAEARGLVLYIAQKFGLGVKEYTPLQVKIAVTGYGKAEKAAVANMLKKILKIGPAVKSDDEFDAIAIGVTALSSRAY